MKIENIDVGSAISNVKELLRAEKDIAPSIRAALEMLVLIISVLFNRVTSNSRNSSKPPSSDPNRRKSSKANGEKKPGGQKGHPGTTLQQVDDPDQIKNILVDQKLIQKEGDYRDAGYLRRQVVEIDISRFVTEYRAQILMNAQGKRIVASFPEDIGRPIQYGVSIKAHAVYLSQFQLIPYDRIREHFEDQMSIPISTGTICNFNKTAYEKLEAFDAWIRNDAANAEVLHVDETGINIGGKRRWLHCASNAELTYFYPHTKRGNEATDEMGVLPKFKGVLVHDHWKPYYRYDCTHALCNAHHLRELEAAIEHDKQAWAKEMKKLLFDLRDAVDAHIEGALPPHQVKHWRQRYIDLLDKSDKECPPPSEQEREEGQRGRLKRSKSRNLLERLRKFEKDVLRFMEDARVPFTNNQGENDLRMTKVQQKISGCFRSEEGAKIFCRIRSYISTCRKRGMTATDALDLLFYGKSPDFMPRLE